uniref:cholesterol 25-hydroxylase-like protein 1, member 2 n=1 Tax=Styela clava TaxID=7725 RepID=UPI00193A7A1D|nr:cholesterol 25-hydroxylase-like protein 1, member 2 [Styela clava]
MALTVRSMIGNYTENEWISDDFLLQPMWDYLRLEIGDFCRSPLFPVLISVAFYFVLNLPFMIMDIKGESWPRIYSNKIQQKPVKLGKMKEAIVCSLQNQVLFVLPAAIYQWLFRPPISLSVQAPSVAEFVLGLLGNMLIFDFQYYWWHRLHHNYRFLYKYVHKLHHEHNSPCSWTTQYVTGCELVAVGIFANLNPLILNQHFLTTHVAILMNIYVSVEAHTGYDFPGSMASVSPFNLWGGAPKHDMHHQKPLTNFQPFFTYLDNIFGTSSDAAHCESRDPLKKQKIILATSN